MVTFALFFALLGSLGALLALSWMLLGVFGIFLCSLGALLDNFVDFGVILTSLGPLGPSKTRRSRESGFDLQELQFLVFVLVWGPSWGHFWLTLGSFWLVLGLKMAPN